MLKAETRGLRSLPLREQMHHECLNTSERGIPYHKR